MTMPKQLTVRKFIKRGDGGFISFKSAELILREMQDVIDSLYHSKER